MTPARQAAFLAALDHCRSRRPAEAEAMLEALIARDADDVGSLLLLATLRLTRDTDAAEALLARCIALAPGNSYALHYLGKVHELRGNMAAAIEVFRRAADANPNFAPTFNDLGASLHHAGERDQALAAFDRAITIDPDYTTAHGNRGLLLAEMRRPEEAREAFRQVLAADRGSPQAWQDFAAAHCNLGDYAQAVAASRQALTLDPSHLDAYATLAEALCRLHRNEEAEEVRAEWARRQGIVVKPCGGERVEARILLVGAAEFCNVPTEHLFDRRRFETISLNLMPPTRAAADPATCIGTLPAFDIVFNAIGDADRGGPFFARAAEFCGRLDRPVLNPPSDISRTRRDMLPALLADIPGLVIPRIRRVARADMAAAAATFDGKPVLVRPAGSHGGDDLTLIDEPLRIATYPQEVPADEYYLSDFCDYHGADGYFRKYRLIFVDRKVYAYHLAITGHWLSHYWRAEMADWMKREEEEFLADFRSVFRGPAADAVGEVAHRLDLDYAGMDCALLPDGRVLLFEANTTMLVHLKESRREFAYKHAHVPRIIDAMSELVIRRMAARQCAPRSELARDALAG
jgi:Flp pilus assembly protein TadD